MHYSSVMLSPGGELRRYGVIYRPEARMLDDRPMTVNLPIEMIQHLMHFLPAEEARVFASTCRTLWEEPIWQRLTQQTFHYCLWAPGFPLEEAQPRPVDLELHPYIHGDHVRQHNHPYRMNPGFLVDRQNPLYLNENEAWHKRYVDLTHAFCVARTATAVVPFRPTRCTRQAQIALILVVVGVAMSIRSWYS